MEAFRPSPSERSIGPGALALGLFAGAYAVAYRYGMSFGEASASPFWFPDSVLLCALLLSAPRRWWLFILTTLPIRLVVAVPPDTPLWFLVATCSLDAVKSVITALALRHFSSKPYAFRTARDFGVFCLFAVFLVPVLTAFGGAAARQGLGHPFWPAWEQWFLGNALTHLVITPALFFWLFASSARWTRPAWPRVVEASLLAGGMIGASYLAFDTRPGWIGSTEPRFYLPVPFLFWAALRFGMPGASAVVFAIACFAVKAALGGRGPFSGQLPGDTALTLQHFLMLRAVPIYVVAILVTKTQSVERSLRESEELFRYMAGTAPVLIWMAGTDKGCTFFNQGWLDFTGRTLEQELGDGWTDGVHPDDRAACHQAYIAAFDARQPFELEYRLRRHDGEYRWVVDRGLPRQSPQGDFMGYIGSVIDMTDRKRSEDTNRSLAQSQRLAMMGRLTAMVAHEIRQPLAAILANADAATHLLQSAHPPLPMVLDILNEIRLADLRAESVVRRIHTLVRERALRLEPLDLNDTIDDALRLVARDAANRRMGIRPQFAQGLPRVQGDRASLQQVILNLVMNAMDAIDGTPDAQRWIRIETRRDDRAGIEVAVTDGGAGFPESRLEHAFEPFVTTKPDGMGLGLAIAHSIVEAHRGQMSAANNQNGGATVRFTLPAEPLPGLRVT